MMSPEELKSVDSFSLCNAYQSGRSEKVKAELERRSEITTEEWKLIEQQKIRIGMTKQPPAKAGGLSITD
jgi:hypothetical protein